MALIAQKTFDRGGVRYRSGDALPVDLDATSAAWYKHHGMAQDATPKEAAPKEVKPAKAKVARHAAPAEMPVAAPAETQETDPQNGG